MIDVFRFGAVRLTALAVLGVIPGVARASLQVYVSPSGSDSASGLSALTPLKTLGAAVSVVRQQRGGSTSTAATINMAGGRYQLTSPIMLVAEDSNLTIAGPLGNTAVITGGSQISGWSKFMTASIKRRLSPAAARAVYSAA